MLTFFENRKILFAAGLIFLCGYAQAQIASTFNANAQAWSTPNDADGTIGYSTTGGNPNGHVFGSPYVYNLGAGSYYVPFDYVAPAAYLGNRNAYKNGTLRYDVQQSATGAANQYAEVVIASSTDTLYYFPSTPNQPVATPAWSTFSVVLNNSSGFWKTANSSTAGLATEVRNNKYS